MFGFQGGESPDTVARKRRHMADAQRKWRFLTNFDCSTIHTGGQLLTMVRVRSGGSHIQAKRDVDAWMAGRDF